MYEIYGDEDPTVTPIRHEDLYRMDYLERVIKETMRLFPVGPLLVRRVTDDLNIGTLFTRNFSKNYCLNSYNDFKPIIIIRYTNFRRIQFNERKLGSDIYNKSSSK